LSKERTVNEQFGRLCKLQLVVVVGRTSSLPLRLSVRRRLRTTKHR